MAKRKTLCHNIYYKKPSFLIKSPITCSCAYKNTLKSSPELWIFTQPFRALTVSHSGVAYIFEIASWYCAVLSAGKPGAPKKPRQFTKEVSIPCSFIVIASGAASTRASEVTPIIFTSHALAKSTASEKPVERAEISPESKAAIALPPASYGIYLTPRASFPAASITIAATK